MSNFLTSIINCRTKIKVRNTVKVIHEEDRFGSRYSKVEKNSNTSLIINHFSEVLFVDINEKVE